MEKQGRAPLERLSFLEGQWDHSGVLAEGPSGPGGVVTGRSSYSWSIGSAWLAFESHLDLPGLGAYEVRGGVTFDAERSIYIAYAANSLGKLIVYDGTWETDSRIVFIQVFPLPAGLARVSYERRDDGSVRMVSDRRSDLGEFEPYFETDMKHAGSEG